ncbi:cupin domain-containing protein [Salimicrobium flavidum]|uniref:Cupin domain-containing protein n=1 Tax=Salimicrobium flavidum TaxID=570947 RepID=A0A1N7KR10_9BACI|nr:hypothetical protein [Salimicrobium flavidum]SIS63994.1 hypothetical protein SAMN05421687_11613 [Salimicrobium flavidum]
MSEPKFKTNITKEEMEKERIVRFDELKQTGVPLMFIDSILPGHQRMNYSYVGDTASENPDYTAAITQPHDFQIGMVKAKPGNGPAYHTHDYIEAFFPLTGQWRFYWGNSEDEIEGETIINPWDLISLPPGLWRGFEVLSDSDEEAWLLAVLEPHKVFDGKDPHWAPQIIRQAEQYGFKADEKGKMIPPENFKDLEKEMDEKLNNDK